MVGNGGALGVGVAHVAPAPAVEAPPFEAELAEEAAVAEGAGLAEPAVMAGSSTTVEATASVVVAAAATASYIDTDLHFFEGPTVIGGASSKLDQSWHVEVPEAEEQ